MPTLNGVAGAPSANETAAGTTETEALVREASPHGSLDPHLLAQEVSNLTVKQQSATIAELKARLSPLQQGQFDRETQQLAHAQTPVKARNCQVNGPTQLIGSPAGPLPFPTPRVGSSITYVSAGANIAEGFGGTLSLGRYSYMSSTGQHIVGTFVTPGLAVGEGASVTGSVGHSSSLNALFGSSVSASVTAGVLSAAVSVNESGLSVSYGGSKGEALIAEATYTVPVGHPTIAGCHR